MAILGLLLMLISFFTAAFGPKSWLKVSVGSSFLLGFIVSFMIMDDETLINHLYIGAIFGIVFSLCVFWGGYWVRKYK